MVNFGAGSPSCATDVKRMLLVDAGAGDGDAGAALHAAVGSTSPTTTPDAAVADKHRRYVDPLMPVAKGWHEVGNDVCDEAIQVFGGMGFVEETGVRSPFAMPASITIYEGTTGIQANDLVGRKILREGGGWLRAS